MITHEQEQTSPGQAAASAPHWAAAWAGTGGTAQVSPSASHTFKLIERLRRAAQFVGAATTLFGSLAFLLGLIGRIFAIALLPELLGLRAIQALGVTLAGAALTLSAPAQGPRWKRLAAWLCAGLAAYAGLRVLAGYFFTGSLPLDRLLPLGSAAGALRQTIGANFAVNLLAVGCALLLLDVEWRGSWRPAQFLALLAGFVSAVALTGWLYGIKAPWGIGAHAAMPWPAALAFLALAVGTLCARPEHGLMAVVTGDTPGGLLIRRLLPAVVAVPLVLGWVRLAGQRAGWYSSELGVAIFVAVGMVVLGVLVWQNARALDRVESDRRHAAGACSLLAAIVESSQDAIIGKTLDGVILTWNAGAERVYGYTAADAIGQHVSMLVPPERAEEIAELLSRLRRGESISNHETVRVNKNGERIRVALTISPVRDSTGRIIGGSVIARDVTELRRTADALQQANAMLTGWLTELEKRTAETGLLNEMGDRLQTCVTAEEAYAVFARLAQRLFPTESGALCVLNASRNLLEAVATWGAEYLGESVFGPEDCWALRRGQPCLFSDPAKELICRHLGEAAKASYFCVPMMAHGEAVGLLHVQAPQGAGHGEEGISEARQRLAISVGRQVAQALANLRLRETLHLQSIRDPLTGLYNRRYLEESLERELRRADRTQRKLGAILLDLDHFKQFNDTHGHDAGDLLLRELGSFLRGRTRREDIACRYGGDEFLLILPEASIEVTRHRADQLREEFARLTVHHGGRLLANVTLSLGVVVFPDHGLNMEQLLRVADQALYRAKSKGRNRVVLGQPIQ